MSASKRLVGEKFILFGLLLRIIKELISHVF